TLGSRFYIKVSASISFLLRFQSHTRCLFRIHYRLAILLIGIDKFVAGIQRQTCALLVFLHQRHASLAAWTTSRLNLAGAHLGVLDKYIGLQGQTKQVIRAATSH